MGSNVFEAEVGKSLRAAGAFTYKFPDGMYASRPGDFLALWKGRGLIIEAKLTTLSISFPLSGWSKAQRAHAAEVEASGGEYWMLVNFRGANMGRGGVACAWRGTELLTMAQHRGSLSSSDGYKLERVTGGWDMSPVLHGLDKQ